MVTEQFPLVVLFCFALFVCLPVFKSSSKIVHQKQISTLNIDCCALHQGVVLCLLGLPEAAKKRNQDITKKSNSFRKKSKKYSVHPCLMADGPARSCQETKSGYQSTKHGTCESFVFQF